MMTQTADMSFGKKDNENIYKRKRLSLIKFSRVDVFQGNQWLEEIGKLFHFIRDRCLIGWGNHT